MDPRASNRRRRLRHVLAIAVGGLVAVGCSSSTPLAVEKTSTQLRVGPTSRAEMSGDELRLVDRLQAPRDAGLLFSDREAMCTVRGLGDRLDGGTADHAIDALTAVDVRQLAHDDAAVVADVVLGCTDFPATLTELYTWMFQTDDEPVRCAVDTLSVKEAHDVAVTIISAEDARQDAEQESLERLVTELGSCLGDAGAVDVLTGRFALDPKNTPDEATCLAEHVVADVGAGRGLRYTAGGAFSGDEARTFIDAMWACRDMRESFRTSMLAQGTTAEVAACLAREVDEADLRNLQIAGLAHRFESALAEEAMSGVATARRFCER